MHLKMLFLLLLFIAKNIFHVSTDMRFADYTGFHVKGKMMVQQVPCMVANCYGLPEISCLSQNNRPSAILISYNGSHTIGCFMAQPPIPVDFSYFSGMWYYKNGRLNELHYFSFTV